MALIDGAAAYYNWDEASGNLIDQVASADGTNSGCTLGAAGILGDAWTFDGGTDLVTNVYNSNDNEWTINVWIKANAVDENWATIYFAHASGTQKITLGRNFNTNFARIETNPSGGTVSVTGTTYNILDGNWHMITATYKVETNGLELWIDGNSEGTATPSGTYSGTNAAQFGGHQGRTDRSWKGEIDETYFLNRKISDAEIAELYGSGTPPGFPFSVAKKTGIIMGHNF